MNNKTTPIDDDKYCLECDNPSVYRCTCGCDITVCEDHYEQQFKTTWLELKRL